MPQGIQNLPPPAVEWRIESDSERKQRLMRSGVLQKPPDQATPSKDAGTSSPVETFSREINELNRRPDGQKANQSSDLLFWFGLDAARWYALRSPKKTSTVTDGSYALSLEIRRADWSWAGAEVGFGPQAVFYHGGQYAPLTGSPLQGQGYADFSSSELGAFLAATRVFKQSGSGWRNFASIGISYLPVRWISADSNSLTGMIARSDTDSRVALSLPGVGARLALGCDWSRFLKGEVFYSLQGAWPLQLRGRFGVQFSLGLVHKLSQIEDR